MGIQARKRSKPQPSVKFYDVKGRIFTKKASKASDLPEDEEDDMN